MAIEVYAHARDEEPIAYVSLATRDDLMDDRVIIYNSPLEKYMIHPSWTQSEFRSKLKEYRNAA